MPGHLRMAEDNGNGNGRHPMTLCGFSMESMEFDIPISMSKDSLESPCSARTSLRIYNGDSQRIHKEES